MEVRRWRKQPKRMENKIANNELDFILLELETEGLSAEVYRYHMKWDISLVYYMFDFQRLDEGMIIPVYLFNEDVYMLEMSEDALFVKALENTVNILQTTFIPLHMYLQEMETECEEIFIPIIQGLVKVMSKIRYDNWLWCVTNSIRGRGTSGVFYKPLLRTFCKRNNCERILIGVGNNDYALAAKVNSNTIPAIKELTYYSNNVKMDSNRILHRAIILYDYRTNSFEEFDEKNLM